MAVILSEPVRDGVRPMRVAAGICRNEAFLSACAATGRDEAEEGDAHRPGDHELRESVSIFLD